MTAQRSAPSAHLLPGPETSKMVIVHIHSSVGETLNTIQAELTISQYPRSLCEATGRVRTYTVNPRNSRRVGSSNSVLDIVPRSQDWEFECDLVTLGPRCAELRGYLDVEILTR
jgi:hypothetical protein